MWMVRSQITPLGADWFVLQHISLSPVHSRHSQTSVWSERSKNNGASTARVTHQIHVTRPKFRGEIHLFDRLQFTHHLSDFHQKEKEASQERESRKETKDQEDQARMRRKNISWSPPDCRKCKSWKKERSLTLTPFWTSSHSIGIPYHLVPLKPLQNPLGTSHHRRQGAQTCCILVLCIRMILYKGKRPTLSTAIGSTTKALSEIVMSVVVWTM